MSISPLQEGDPTLSTDVTTQSTAIGDVVKLLNNYKAYAAFLAPLLLAIGAAVASWIVSGEFNANEIRTATGGAVTALVAAVATWLTSAGSAVVVVDPGSQPVDPADPDPVVPPGV